MLLDPNYDLMFLIDQLSHSMFLARKKELNNYGIYVRQLRVLFTIRDLGSNATITRIAKRVKRKVEVISRQCISLEEGGFLVRHRKTPGSNLLTLELTEKGIEITDSLCRSKSVDRIFSILSTEDRKQFISFLKQLVDMAKN